MNKKRGRDDYYKNSFIQVRRSEIPFYLQTGEFYKSLSEDDDELPVPANALKPDLAVKNKTAALHLLHSLRFWGVTVFPDELIAFCLSSKGNGFEHVLAHFSEEVSTVKPLMMLCQPQYHNKIESMIGLGDIEILKYLHKTGYSFVNAGQFAVSADQPGVLEYLMENGEPLEQKLLFQAAFEEKSIKCVKFFRNKGWPWPSGPCQRALSSGSLPLLQYVREQGCAWGPRHIFYDRAIQEDFFDCVKYAHEHGCPATIGAMQSAAYQGNLKFLTYFHSQGFLWDVHVASSAARKGHVSCLQFLHENGCPWGVFTSRSAVHGGLACLKYVCENGCPINEMVYSEAARTGDVSILNYLKTLSCARDISACVLAAKMGHLECLKYLHQDGCPWGDEQICVAAAETGKLECLKFALQNGCPISNVTFQASRSKVFAYKERVNKNCEKYVRKLLNIPPEAVAI